MALKSLVRRTGKRRFGALLAGASLALTPAFAAAAESSGGIAALGISLPGLIQNLVNFTILLVVLRLFLYKPLFRVLDERKRKIQEGIDRASAAANTAAESEAEARRILDQARAEGQESVRRAQESAARLREELEARARQDADQIVARAREEVALERDQAIEQLRREFADLTIVAAERVINQSLDRQAHQRLIDEVLVNSQAGRN
ncbi:MAG: F0F1 ATP synthase subunit B [Dehalococcoidia bacterium]|nr:F0F1 ATP synthase subunit B [Dehalococcoidia bacterium]HRC62449.1 F0F1 ATP synthase subunit B [Dehalococcoidia bacterium]